MTPEQLEKANTLKHQIEVLEIKIRKMAKILNQKNLSIKIESTTYDFYMIEDDIEFENLVKLKLNSDIEQCNLKIKTLQEEFDNL
jgi:hypothetical protein